MKMEGIKISLLAFSLKDGMQVDLKSECFTPESRPNKDFTRDSLNIHCKTVFHCGNCNVNLCFSPDRDCFTKWHGRKYARVRALVNENGRNKD
jgi:hypothetical protein